MLRHAYPKVPIISTTEDVPEYYQLLEAGADSVCVTQREGNLYI